MKITVKLGGPLRKKIEGHVGGELILDLAEGARVSTALDALGLPHEEVRVLMLNGLAIPGDVELKDGDRLGLFPKEQAFNVITAVSFFNPLARKD